MMLITGVVAAAILIVAVLPVVWSMVGTFSSASAETDARMRTDFKIVTTYACGSATCSPRYVAKVWMKNIGTNKIGESEIQRSDVLAGTTTNFMRPTYYSSPCPPTSGARWCYILSEPSGSNGFWDPGETLEIDAWPYIGLNNIITGPNLNVYFQFILPNSVWRTEEFTSI
jgi:flagellar protein FlaG